MVDFASEKYSGSTDTGTPGTSREIYSEDAYDLLFVHVSEMSCSINCPEGRMDRKNISSAFLWEVGFLINSFYMHVQG